MKYFRKTLKYISLLILLISLDSFLFERYYTSYPELEYYNSKIPAEFDGLRIAVISDLHYGSLDPEFWIRWVLDRTMDQNPDLIV